MPVCNLFEDKDEKDRCRDRIQKDKHGLESQLNGGFKKDAKYECGLSCELELVLELGDSVGDVVGGRDYKRKVKGKEK